MNPQIDTLAISVGRSSRLTSREAIDRLRKGEAQADIARTYGLDATTIGRLGCAPAQKNGV
jgi:hypothetical protein